MGSKSFDLQRPEGCECVDKEDYSGTYNIRGKVPPASYYGFADLGFKPYLRCCTDDGFVNLWSSATWDLKRLPNCLYSIKV